MMGRALRHPNFRLFFAGQAISLIGTWMQMIATSWLVYRLTGSAWWLGMSNFASRIPSVVLTPLAGVLIDRFDRHRIVLAAQILAAVQAAILAALSLTGLVEVWHVVALGMLLGVANAFDVPARQSLIIHLVEGREDLSNAIALNSSMFNSARLIGPAVAGALTAAFGEGVCFLINALSYIAVIWALLAMRLPRHETASVGQVPVWQGLRDGFAYAWSTRPIRLLIGLIALASLMGTPYMVLGDGLRLADGRVRRGGAVWRGLPGQPAHRGGARAHHPGGLVRVQPGAHLAVVLTQLRAVVGAHGVHRRLHDGADGFGQHAAADGCGRR